MCLRVIGEWGVLGGVGEGRVRFVMGLVLERVGKG